MLKVVESLSVGLYSSILGHVLVTKSKDICLASMKCLLTSIKSQNVVSALL